MVEYTRICGEGKDSYPQCAEQLGIVRTLVNVICSWTCQELWRLIGGFGMDHVERDGSRIVITFRDREMTDVACSLSGDVPIPRVRDLKCRIRRQ